jgi:hypothetical protein
MGESGLLGICGAAVVVLVFLLVRLLVRSAKRIENVRGRFGLVKLKWYDGDKNV